MEDMLLVPLFVFVVGIVGFGLCSAPVTRFLTDVATGSF